MKKHLLLLSILTTVAIHSWAQDPAIAGIDEGKSPIQIGEKTFITADFINGSSSAFASTTTVQWIINTPPCIEIKPTGTYFFFDDVAAANYVNVTTTAYDAVNGQILYITSKPNVAFPGNLIGAWNITFEVYGKTLGVNQPYSIQAISNPLVGTNNSGNDNVANAITVIAPLPILLVDFSASKKNTEVQLDWQTTGAVNFSHYDVERSADGRSFSRLGMVKGGVVKSYNFTDDSPLSGTNIYRLKMVDADGSFKYSDSRKVNFTSAMSTSIYPNPAKNEVNIATQGSAIGRAAILKFSDMFGKVVYSQQLTTLNSVETINIANFASGTYNLSIITEDGQLSTFLLIVQN